MKTLLMILTCFYLTAGAQTKLENKGLGVPMGNVMPGPNAVYGFIATGNNKNSFNMYLGSIKRFDVYKDERGNGSFRKIQTLTFPSSYSEFVKRAGEGTAQQIKNAFNAKTDEEAYRGLLSGDPQKIGFLFLSKDFLTGIGALWQDNDIKNSQPSTTYKVVSVDAKDQEANLFVQKLGDITRIPFAKYELQDLVSSDSVVQISWATKIQGTPAFMGKVYRKASTEKTFQLMPSTTLIYDMADSSKTYYQENVASGKLYQYYLIPEDFAGNQGLPSDTATALSKSFSKIKVISDFKIKDSLKGAWLSWSALPNEGVYTGIQILKSRKSNAGFVEVATLSPIDTSYFDRAILPNVVYHYQIRPTLVNVKGYSMLSPATASVAVKNANEIPMAPQGLKVWQDSTAQVKLYWDVNPEVDQFAYYVYRGTSKDNMQLISGGLRTNIYVDSLSNLDGETTYWYGIKLMNISQKMSELSTTVPFKPLKIAFVPYPSGISARYAYGVVKLNWDNILEKYDNLIGYRLYRKKKDEKEFKLLSPDIISLAYFEDSTATAGNTYNYAVSAINTTNNQSVLSPLTNISISVEQLLAPPADLYLVNKPQGIYVSWPAHAELKASNVVYRKSSTETSYRAIGEVEADNYLDTSAQKGVLYLYHIVVKNKLGASNPSVEKSIRRN